MMSFLGAASHVVVPGDVQWAHMGPYERGGGPCQIADLFDFGSFLTQILNLAVEKWIRRASFWRVRGLPWLSFGAVGGPTAIRGWAWVTYIHRLEGSRPRARCAPQAARLQVGYPLQQGRLYPPILAGAGTALDLM